jgi:predicted AAA+ superfamily ATPase
VDRALWWEAYATTYLERDLRQLSAVDNLLDFRRLMRAACLRLGGVLNQSELARDVALPPTTTQRYLNLLETSHHIVRVPAWVDFIVEWPNGLLPVEVKASRRVHPADAAGLRAFLAESRGRSHAGRLLYGGNEAFWLTGGVLAVPWWRSSDGAVRGARERPVHAIGQRFRQFTRNSQGVVRRQLLF